MYKLFFKRLFDLVFSLFLLVLLVPIFLFVPLLILSDMGRPIFFTQNRSGKNKKSFKIFKFRTMRYPSKGATDESRITRLGDVLRRLSIDELPQLINVIKGDMSLIGPRPLLPEYDEHYSNEQNKRFLIKPGVTGLAQVLGRNDLTWDEKFSLDIQYVENLSFSSDLKILIKTIYVVFGAKGFRKSGEDKKFSDV
ncbi:sugar transferase [Litoricolaceae bacterium]|nr:sugar transferase [Litorivicinaceae bacterium]